MADDNRHDLPPPSSDPMNQAKRGIIDLSLTSWGENTLQQHYHSSRENYRQRRAAEAPIEPLNINLILTSVL